MSTFIHSYSLPSHPLSTEHSIIPPYPNSIKPSTDIILSNCAQSDSTVREPQPRTSSVIPLYASFKLHNV